MAPKVPGEEVLGRKWDRCLADTTIKTGTGVAIGAIASLIFFKRKVWPVTLGTGIGLGMGYSNCQHTFRSREAPCPRFGPPVWHMDPEGREKWKKHWEEKWKTFKPKEAVGPFKKEDAEAKEKWKKHWEEKWKSLPREEVALEFKEEVPLEKEDPKEKERFIKHQEEISRSLPREIVSLEENVSEKTEK